MKSARAPRATRGLVALAVLLSLIALPLYAWKVYSKTEYTDFFVYYRAATRFHAGDWGSIYTLADGASPFRYAPVFLPWLEPLAWLPRQSAQLLWYGLQVAAFGVGFRTLFQVLRLSAGRARARAPFALALGFLFVFRLLLDSFTIGQISGLLFLSFALALWGFVRRRSLAMGLGVSIPAWLKIGPGVLFLLLSGVRDPRRKWRTTLAAPLGISALLGAALLARLPVGSIQQILWEGWAFIVRADSAYYDASHYGSQSIKSVLLRSAHAGWITAEGAELLYWGILAAGVSLLALFWWLRRPIDALGRGLFFSLGLFAVMLFMPETFKYSLIPLAIPVSLLLLIPRSQQFSRLAIGFGALVISLAGKDLLSDALFFGLQRWNLPALAVVLLAIATARESWRRSKPSLLAQWSFPRALAPWSRQPAGFKGRGAQAWLLLPLHSESRLTPAIARHALGRLQEAMAADLTAWQGGVTILPFGNRADTRHPVVQELQRETARLRLSSPPRWIWSERTLESTAMEACLEAYLEGGAPTIACLNAEQMPDADSIARAVREIGAGSMQWIGLSRRHPESRLRFQVRSLSRAYGRYRAGRRLHAWLGRLLGDLGPWTDTQSGSFVLASTLADRVFPVIHFTGFGAGVELHRLAAQAVGSRAVSWPAEFSLPAEKTWAHMAREALEIALRIPLLIWRPARLPEAAPLPAGLTADDWGLSRAVNEGILELVQLGVVRRVSILTAGEALDWKLAELAALARAGRVELGLHFNLTYGPEHRAHARPARAAWKWLTLSSRARREWVQSEFARQRGALAQRGVELAYLDGHHHIHLLPGLLAHLRDALREAGVRTVRTPYNARQWLNTRAVLNILSLFARRELTRQGLRTAPVLYPPFGAYSDRARLLAQLQAQARRAPHSEVICHPAVRNDLGSLQTPEPYYQDERITEFRTLRMLGQMAAAPGSRLGAGQPEARP